MEYRSPFEIKQSILEEVGALSSMGSSGVKKPSKKGSSSKDKEKPADGSGGGGTAAYDPTALEREMPENMDALNANMKLEEDVQRHIETANLPPQEVALYIMANGSTNQKISMFHYLHKSVKDIDEKKMTQLLSGLMESMWAQAPELQCAAPAGLLNILPLLRNTHVAQLLQGAKTMLEVRTLEVRAAWGPFLLSLVEHINAAQIIDVAVPLSLKKCEHVEPPDQRVLACTLMGKICSRLDADQVMSSPVLSKALAMCQDTNVSVRCEMCCQLREVAKAIGLENAKVKVTAELFELLSDEERLVSRAAFSCLIDLIEFFDAAYRREHFYPIIKAFISNPPEEVLSLLIEEFGRFLWKIKSDVQGNEDVMLFASFFKQCSLKTDSEVRRMCAFNLPAVVASLPVSAYPSYLHVCTKTLASDPHTPVRRAVAAGLHELAPLLGEKASQYLCETFVTIAQDPSIDVRSVLMKNAPSLLSCFASQLKAEKEREAFFNSLVPAFLSFDQLCQKDWRRTNMLLDAMVKFPEYYSGQVLYEKFVPILMRLLKDGANVIKDLCADLLMSFAACIHNTASTVDVFGRIYNEFGKHTSCYQRLNYVRLFSYACEYFSRRFLRERMLELLLELSRDTVVNLRIAVAKVAPKIRKLMRQPFATPQEQTMWDNFQGTLQRLQMDDDELVRNAARDSNEAIEPIDREYLRLATMKNPQPTPEDLVDKRREEGEGNLIEAAKEHDKAERRSKLKELLKNEKEKEEPAPAGRKSNVPPKRVSGAVGSSSSLSSFTSHTSPAPTSSFSTGVAPKVGSSGSSSSGAQRVSAVSSGGNKTASGGATPSSISSSQVGGVRSSLTKR